MPNLLGMCDSAAVALTKEQGEDASSVEKESFGSAQDCCGNSNDAVVEKQVQEEAPSQKERILLLLDTQSLTK